MTKRVSLILALVLVLVAIAMPSLAEMTDVGTPRNETLICEPDADVNAVPGQFNPYMSGTPSSWGMHQIMWGEGLWEVNTMTGENIPTIAAELATPNEDYTEWTIKIREGLKWSDGEALDANDVKFTFDAIMTIPDMSNYSYYNSLFNGMELVDDYTVKVSCKETFTRIMTTLGVNMWGCSFRIIPEHVYSQVDDILTFPDSEPLAAGPYVIKDYDQLGTWILYEKRADWDCTPTGQLYGEPGPQYILYRVFGNTESRVMAMIQNQVDIMNEVSYEDLQIMLDANDKVRGWYKDFPYANTDDACSKGANFNCGIEPFDDVNVRWALTLCCNWVEVSENIFEGIGRMSALSVPSITAMENFYVVPMTDWLSEFVIDGTDIKVWDTEFALTLRDALVEDYGYDLSAYSDDEIKAMFGHGYFRTDVEAATKLLEDTGRFELKDGKWYFDGEPFKIEVIVHPEDSSTQASRSAKAIADQWAKFGIDIEITTLTGADLDTRVNLGDFQVSDNWPICSSYFKDFYNNITGWNCHIYSYEVGETATGWSAFRYSIADPEGAEALAQLVEKAATLDPNSDEAYETMTEFLKVAFAAHVNITVQAGTKIVPINETYWTGMPTAEDPYEGPWWWWSSFRFTTTHLVPAE